MAKFDSGFLLGFTGKLGNVIVYKRNGKYFARSVPKKRKDNPTPTQLELRAKFALMSAFIRQMSPVLAKTYKSERYAHSNSAFARNYDHAICGSYPDLSIDFSKVLLANGNLESTHQAMVKLHGAGKVKFTWNHACYGIGSADHDNVVLICYCPELKKLHWTVGPAIRSDGKAVLALPEFQGKEMHAWMTFISRTDVAQSAYCGSVVVSTGKRRKASPASEGACIQPVRWN